MKVYKRTDGYEVHDCQDRPIEWAVETYGGEFVEVIPTPIVPPTANELRVKEIDALLAGLDLKSIRALREGNTVRIGEIEAQAVILRNERLTLV